MRLKFRLKKGEVLILGNSKEECRPLEEKMNEVITELGPTISYRTITDKKKLMAFGVTQTPSVIIVSYKTKSQGQDPSLEVLKEWVKEII